MDGSGALVSSFTGVWAVDLSDLVAILDLQEHYAKANAEPACVPRDRHACWTIYETWAQVVDWQKEHCSAPESTQ